MEPGPVDDRLMTIGEFSRLVGVTPSALRYYDDCGLLVPAHTAVTGYRFYAPEQHDRATVIRLLREAGLPLADVRRVVDGPGDDLPRLVREHLVRTADQARTSAAALRQALRTMLPAGEHSAQAHVRGPELASGIRQVRHAAGHPTAPAVPELDLTRVRVEIDVDEVRLVATDRYRLALRSLPTRRADGGVAAVAVAAGDLVALVPALLLADVAVLGVGRSGLTCVVGDHPHVLAGRHDGFPDYRAMLDCMAPAAARLVADRADLLTMLRPFGPDAVVLLTVADGGARVVAGPLAGEVRPIAATWLGPRFPVAFAAGHLEQALAAGVGPDVIIELADGPRPAVVRSADHGSFTTLVMPRALPGRRPLAASPR